MIIQPEDLDAALEHTLDAQIELKRIIGDRRNGNKPNPAREILETEENTQDVLTQTIKYFEKWQDKLSAHEKGLAPDKEQNEIKQCLTGLLLAKNDLAGIYCQFDGLQEALDVARIIDKAADILIFSGREGAEI